MEWMRLLADACHNLPKSLQPSVAAGRKHRATDAIQYLLATASPLQRQWLVVTLARNGIAECKQRATQPRNDAIARAASPSACSGRASQPIHPSSIVGVDPLRADSR